MSRIEELEALMPITEDEAQEKYGASFEKQARYLGNGVYAWHSIYSNDTRELFVQGVLAREGVVIPDEYDEDYEGN
jgi:hypothetical protein